MRHWLLATCAICGLVVHGGPAAAETLEEALAEAYQTNPQIQTQRAVLRQTNEGVSQATSGWRPTVQFTGSQGLNRTWQTPTPAHTTLQPKNLDLNITQNLYQGGRTTAQVRAAENSVQAQRAQTLATEAAIMFSVAQAYLDVVRDQNLVALNINNEQVLRRQLEAVNDEFRVGEVTRTDVAQSESRLANATAQRTISEGNLQNSRANYERAVGHLPPRLDVPELQPPIPATKEEAISLATSNNKGVIVAMYNAKAAEDTVDATRALLLPNLNLIGDLNKADESNTNGRYVSQASLVARVTIPLYEAGSIYSQTRQAQQVVGQRQGQLDDARRQAIQAAARDWETIQSVSASIRSLQANIRASEIALEGTRQEQQVGSRTILDVLNAEQELFNARGQLTTAQHDLAIAQFDLTQQIGRMNVNDLKLPVQAYDMDRHYRSVRNKWLGFGSED